VDNAVRYTPEGGTVNAAVRRDGADVEATLEDNGPGIPEDERTRVFDRFYRGPTATATGTGLGLAIVSQVVEMHRGSVALGASDEGGLQVRVRIPTQRA
jgi:signal transduction histidine kinase